MKKLLFGEEEGVRDESDLLAVEEENDTDLE